MPERKHYIDFTEVTIEPPRKTKQWSVYSTSSTFLGNVRWYGPWRAYCFYPAGHTIFNDGCLVDITEFVRSQTQLHRAVAKRKVSQ